MVLHTSCWHCHHRKRRGTSVSTQPKTTFLRQKKIGRPTNPLKLLRASQNFIPCPLEGATGTLGWCCPPGWAPPLSSPPPGTATRGGRGDTAWVACSPAALRDLHAEKLSSCELLPPTSESFANQSEPNPGLNSDSHVTEVWCACEAAGYLTPIFPHWFCRNLCNYPLWGGQIVGSYPLISVIIRRWTWVQLTGWASLLDLDDTTALGSC